VLLQVCKDILFSLAGVELFDVDIKTVKQWVMDAKVASRYLSSNQRVILAGDAAHRFPPAGGFGIDPAGLIEAFAMHLPWFLGQT
jgi:2-polyprenyl-6-methoxyphenol hydroxylase-like FAD-dependent oxidoreductase